MSLTVSGGNPMLDSSQGFDDFPGSLLESHFALPRMKKPNKRKQTGMPSDIEQDDDMDDDGGDMGTGEDDEVTEEDIQNIVKMTDYIEKYVLPAKNCDLTLNIISATLHIFC